MSHTTRSHTTSPTTLHTAYLGRSVRTLLVGVAALPMLGLAIGCETQGRRARGDGTVNLQAGLPMDARPVSGESSDISFTAQDAGRVFVYDVTRNETIGAFNVRPGQRFVVDSVSRRATLDGNEVNVGNVRGNHLYRLYFRSSTADATAPMATPMGQSDMNRVTTPNQGSMNVGGSPR